MRNKKTHKLSNKRHKTRSKSKNVRGGRAVDAGSYGCVFIPALKCKDSSNKYNPNYVSKLMYKEDAKSEMEEIKKIEAYVSKIPNNDKYFILSNIYQCKPDKITDKENLVTFDAQCRLFTKRSINSNNLNENLDKLELINMPNGGLSIQKYIAKILELSNKYNLFINLNTALIELLTKGIIPINKQRFNHYDIKSDNVLFSEDGHARLIDWGLAGSNDGITIPNVIVNRSIAFNMPFSDIFFNSYIKKWLPEEMNKIKSSPNFNNKTEGQSELLKVIAVNMINKSIEETSEGHYEVITTSILHDIYKIYASKNRYNILDFNVLTYNVLIEYIQAVLLKYVDEDGNFNDVDYFYNVFVHNVDIWGFIMIYLPFIASGYNKLHKDIINGICRILLRYCFSPEFAVKPINVSELVSDLTSLNDIARNIK
jgi:hypothetical protein